MVSPPATQGMYNITALILHNLNNYHDLTLIQLEPSPWSPNSGDLSHSFRIQGTP